MAGGSKNCRDCGAPIQFIEGRNGRWIPVTPGTEDRHRCELDQTCENCEKTFKGAPWMKTCPDCYKGGRSSRSSPGPASPPRTKERLDPGGEDDVPF
jgi:hypothetical protein